MEKIKQKIVESLRKKIGEEFGQNILIALGDQNIEQQIKLLMAQDKIQLLNSQNQPVFTKEIKKAAVGQPAENEDALSPELKKTNTKLVSYFNS